jgi:hypothetical protein
MEITTVKTKTDLMKFIKFPWKVYKDDPYWVPQLISETKTILDVNKNPFWKHSELKMFVARDKGEIVGRIAGVIDRNYIQFQNDNCGFFAFFECINNNSVARMLLDSVRNWLKEKGITRMIGPTAPSTNDEMGLLYEGYDSSPYLMMPYNPEYYHDLLLAYGLKKAKDLYAYYLHSEKLPRKRLDTLAKGVMRRIPELSVRPLNMKEFDSEMRRAKEVYNSAWEKNWGFVPWTDEEFYWQCKKLKPLVVRQLVLLAFVKDKPIGILIAVPDYNRVMKKLNGKLGPVELIKFLWYKNKLHSIRIMVMGMIKEYRMRGIEGLMYWHVINNGLKLGYYEGEMSWILEDNEMMCRAAEMLGGKLYKKYRVYEG